MKSFLTSRVTYYVGFSLMYLFLNKIWGFETTVLIGLGAIIGEQAYLKIDKFLGR